MRHAVHQVAFTSDGRSVAAIDEFGESRTWPVPEPLQDASIDDLTLRIEARTGLRMETGLAISRLDAAAWRERLEQLGRLDPAAVQPDDDPAWHEPMIREAEQNGNAFAAIWHLDRLIAARPDDWFLYARRARAWSLSDKFDKAAADYQQAERLGSREQVLDFQAHCVIDCTKAERWAEALWYLDRLIAARPDDGSLHEDRAAVYGKLGREADRQAELARVFELGADRGTGHPPGRGARPRRPLGRGRGPAGTLRPDRSAQPGAGPGLGHRLPEGGRPRRLPRGLRGGHWPARDRTRRSSGTRSPRRRSSPWGPRAWTTTRCRSDGSRAGCPPFPRHHPSTGTYFSNALGGLLLRAGRIDEAIARLNEGIAAAKEAKSRIPHRLGLPGPGPRAKGELCRSPPVARTPPRFAS